MASWPVPTKLTMWPGNRQNLLDVATRNQHDLVSRCRHWMPSAALVHPHSSRRRRPDRRRAQVLVTSWHENTFCITALIARFMEPTWGPFGDRTQVGLMSAPLTLLSGWPCVSRIHWWIPTQRATNTETFVNGETTDGFPSQRASNIEVWSFLCCRSKQAVEQTASICRWVGTPWRSYDVTVMHVV